MLTVTYDANKCCNVSQDSSIGHSLVSCNFSVPIAIFFSSD